MKTFPSETRRIYTSCGNAFVTLVFNQSQTRIEKVLCQMGKAGGCASAHLRSLSNDLDAILKLKTVGERIPYYTEKTGMSCHLPVCCVEKISRYILYKDIELSEKEKE